MALPTKELAASYCGWLPPCIDLAIGFIPFLISTARRTGVSAYIDDGANRWPAVRRYDAATLYRLAVEKAPAGSALHAIVESGTTFRPSRI